MQERINADHKELITEKPFNMHLEWDGEERGMLDEAHKIEWLKNQSVLDCSELINKHMDKSDFDSIDLLLNHRKSNNLTPIGMAGSNPSSRLSKSPTYMGSLQPMFKMMKMQLYQNPLSGLSNRQKQLLKEVKSSLSEPKELKFYSGHLDGGSGK